MRGGVSKLLLFSNTHSSLVYKDKNHCNNGTVIRFTDTNSTVEITLSLLQLSFTIQEWTGGVLHWATSETSAQIGKSSLFRIPLVSLCPEGVQHPHCVGLMWIVWCPAHLSWGHMGAQGFIECLEHHSIHTPQNIVPCQEGG